MEGESGGGGRETRGCKLHCCDGTHMTFSQLSTVAHRVRVTIASPNVSKVLWGLSKSSVSPPKKLMPARVSA